MKKLIALAFQLMTLSVFSQVYILNEDFATATGITPPVNWQNNTITGPANATWHFDNPGSRTINYPITAPFAILDAPKVAPDTALEVVSLETPFFDASVGSYTLLFFDHSFFPDSAAKATILAYNGSTWTEVISYTVSSTTNPTSEVIDLTAICAGKTNAKLRFQWEGHGKGYWAIDNIRIYAPLLLDAGISAIDSPAIPFTAGIHNIKVTLKNFGYQTITTAMIKWSVNGIMQTPFNWNGSIPFGSSQQAINIGNYNFPSTSVSKMKIWSEMPNSNPDPNHFNDSTIQGLNAALCGIYTIGGSNPNFQTFNDAVSMITSVGITCPVIFKVRNGTYMEQIEINPIPGSSLVNTVTFESESGDSSSVLIWSPGGIELPTIKLNGAKNIIIQKLSVKKEYNRVGAILIDNHSENVSINNCYLFSNQYSLAISVKNGSKIISIIKNFFPPESTYTSKIEVSNAENVQIIENKIYFLHSTGGGVISKAIFGYSWINNLLIYNNDIYCSGSSAITLNTLNDSVQVIQNRLYEANITINSGNDSGSCIVQGNRIVSSTTSGLIIYGKNVQISNNYITISGNVPFNGIEANNCTTLKLICNNINLLNSNINSKCFLLNGGSALEIKNNIFANSGGGFSAYISNNPSLSSWDYNNYYNLNKRIGFMGDRTYQSFSTWALAINGEDHGLCANPFFTNNSNLIPHQVLLKNAGLLMPEVLYDIDSTLRDASNPDIGAKEFPVCSLDAGVNDVSAPQTPIIAGVQEVKVILQNQGTIPLTSVIIHWEINGIQQTPYPWSGTLTGKQNAEIILGTFFFLSGTKYQIKAWSTDPNNGLDCDPHNDTVLSPKIYAKLCGSYTIGGVNPNFQTFTDAIYALHSAGITCPVIFNVRSGTYFEQTEINAIPGSSATNTVTFRSETGDSSQVLLTSFGHQQRTITLNGAQNLIFKHIGIKHQHNYGEHEGGSIMIENSSANISIINCLIISDPASRGIIIGNGSGNISILKNQFYGNLNYGNYIDNIGIAMSDAENIEINENKFFRYSRAINAQSGVLNKIIINNNEVKDCRNFGFLIHTLFDSIFITNNVLIGSAININSIECNGWILIQGNRISTLLSSGLIINTKNCLVANNYITIFGPLPLNGIEVNNCINAKIAFNNIHLLNDNLKSTCILLNGGNSIDIKNNIFSNPFGGYSSFVINNPNSCQWDYNNYLNNYKRIGFFGDSTYQSLYSWSTVINGESHGLSCNPFFSNDSTLVPHQILLNNVGLPNTAVPYDIDSTLRNVEHPDIGAKEFSPCDLDAGINMVTAPVTPVTPGLQDLKVILQNQGLSTLTSVSINWSLNGIMQIPIDWAGQLLSAENLEIAMASYYFISGTVYQIKAWTTSPNNGIDCDASNDTIICNNIYTKLCGSYTIGGNSPNFSSISDAISVLNNAGITCPVIFKVRDGTYFEHVELNAIPGSSMLNTVTFESESQDSSKVTLVNPEISTAAITFNEAKNICIRKIGIIQNQSYYPEGLISIGNESENINISNCKMVATNSEYYISIKGWASKITIMKNFLSCTPHTVRTGIQIGNGLNINIIGNKIQKCWGNAIIGYNFKKLNINENEVKQCGQEGIYINNSVSDTAFITNNKLVGSNININSSGSYGLCIIQGNQIATSVSTGIVLNARNCIAANNYITISGNSIGNGIEAINCNQVKIVFNSINVLTDNVNSSKCLQISGGNSLDIINNIFMNSGLGYCISTDNPPTNSRWDYNDYHSISSKIGFKNGLGYSTLSSWSTAIGGEANGRNLNPYFANDSSYKVYQRGLNGAGIPIPGVLFDIEGKIRNDQAPDIGAWEFMVDFGITQVLHPTLACSHNPNDSLTIWIRQYGDVPFTNIKLAFTINNGPVTYDTIVGTIYNDIIYTFKQRINIANQGDYTIKCWLVDNIDDNVNNDTITVTRYSYPSPLVDFAWSNPCQGQETHFLATASIDPPYHIAGYEWIFGDGDTSFVQNPVHVYQHAGPKSVTLKAYQNMGCYKDSTKTVVIHPYSDPTISGVDSLCEGSSGVVYATQPGKSNYSWTISPGGAITSGIGTQTITVTWNEGGQQWIIVNYQNAEGCSAPVPCRLDIVVSPAPTPTISGPASFCIGTQQANYQTEPGMVNYTWTVSPGGTIVSGTASNVITVNWDAHGAQLVSVGYQNTLGCAAKAPAILPVSVFGIVGAAGPITGDTMVCAGTQSRHYQIAPIPHATSYSWIIPLGVIIANGSGSNDITVNFSNSTGVGYFTVHGQNECYQGISSPAHKVVINAPLVGYENIGNKIIPPSFKECISAQGITTAGGGTVFAIQPSGDARLIASEYIRMLNGTSVQSGGRLLATVTNQCIPCNTIKALTFDSSGIYPTANLQIPEINAGMFRVYPNPTSGKFTVEVTLKVFSSEATIKVFGFMGQLIINEKLGSSHVRELSIEDRPSGIYMIQFTDGVLSDHTRIIKTE